MNRLQKKCFFASAGFHLLLGLILLIGPAFLATRPADNPPPLDVIPWNTVDALVSGGGNPNARPPAAVVQPPAPQLPAPAPQPVVVPSPPKPAPVEPEVEPPSQPAEVTEPTPKPKSKPKPRLPDVSTTIVTRNADDAKKAKAKADARARQQAKEIAEAQRQAAAAFNRAVAGISHSFAPTTTIEGNYGAGGGGEAYANYSQVVKAIYEQAWIAPDDTASDSAITKVTVTIARDGTVVSARIIQRSGDAKVDQSVQSTLDRVTFIRPFPEGSTDRQRSFTINFNLKAKRLLG